MPAKQTTFDPYAKPGEIRLADGTVIKWEDAVQRDIDGGNDVLSGQQAAERAAGYIPWAILLGMRTDLIT